jgi:hypothetical protein
MNHGATHLTLRPELDRLHCGDPNCGAAGELILYPACHADSLTIATYRKGELALECAECGEVYLNVLVAG